MAAGQSDGGNVVGASWQIENNMARHTTFRYCLDPTVEQQEALFRHAGAARFAYNQSLRLVKTALDAHGGDWGEVPWSRFDLIKAFNAWKTSEAAGRLFTVDPAGVAAIAVTGLSWRREIIQQVFEEAAADCSDALRNWSAARSGQRAGARVRFPKFKTKRRGRSSFRLRNRHSKFGTPSIRVGDNSITRSVTLPGFGVLKVHDDTRRLRRLIAKSRAKILFATIQYHAGRWWVSLNVEAADLHEGQRHGTEKVVEDSGWVGLDRGLATFLVAATAEGREVSRITSAPKPLFTGLETDRQLSRKVSRRQKGSKRRQRAVKRLARHRARVRNVRRHFLHQVSNGLVKTHDRLAIEDLNVAGMLRNRRLARSIVDAGWAELSRQLRYKQLWRGGHIAVVDRWYPSTQICALCERRRKVTLADRTFVCECGHRADRDLNAAINLAKWAQRNASPNPRTPKQEAGSTMPVDVAALTGARMHRSVAVSDDAGTDIHLVHPG